MLDYGSNEEKQKNLKWYLTVVLVSEGVADFKDPCIVFQFKYDEFKKVGIIIEVLLSRTNNSYEFTIELAI